MDPETGSFLTADPFYSPEEFVTFKPEFKRSTSKDSPKADDPHYFVPKIQQVDLAQYRNKDNDLYRQVIQDTLTLCEEEIINPYVSETFSIDQINQAVNFIKDKKCTGKVLIDLKLKEDSDDSDDESEKDDKTQKQEKKNSSKDEAKSNTKS